MFQILEDGSPFFIRFKYVDIENFIKFARENFHVVNYENSLIADPDVGNHYLPITDPQLLNQFLDMVPFTNLLPMNTERVAYLASKPYTMSHLHIDNASISLNYGISMADDLCVTSWYDYDLVEKTYYSKNNMPWDRHSVSIPQITENKIPSIKSFIQQEGECTLFNSDYYHCVDNSNSPNHRIVLTFRLAPPTIMNFEQVKKWLFGDHLIDNFIF